MPDIVDIRALHDLHNPASPNYDVEFRDQLCSGLFQPAGAKYLPTVLLYDEPGLRLYDCITTSAPEYYLFPAEEDILKHHAGEIVHAMHMSSGGEINHGEIVLELGAG